MTVCPIAIVSGCKKCPAFRICSLKTVLGDYGPEDGETKTASKAGAATAAKGGRKRRK